MFQRLFIVCLLSVSTKSVWLIQFNMQDFVKACVRFFVATEEINSSQVKTSFSKCFPAYLMQKRTADDEEDKKTV